jgi:uncharacterized membrane protein/glutaredoxin
MLPKHIVEIFLVYTKVPFTKRALRETLRKNPHRDTYAGIQDTLLDYRIKSVGITLSMNELQEIKDPFITLLDKKYVVVTSFSENSAQYITESNKKESMPADTFSQQWSGNILFPEITIESKEQNLLKNRLEAFFSLMKLPLSLVLFLMIVWGVLPTGNVLYNVPNGLFLMIVWGVLPTDSPRYQFPIMALFFLFFTGLTLSVLLMRQSMEGGNSLIRKICELSKHTSCNRVLESKGAKLFGVIGWSEIGAIYFSGSFFFLLMSGETALPLLFWINIVSLPYSFWSVLYQWKMVKKWCVLCLAVQLLFWLIFFVFVISGQDLFLLELTTNLIISFFLSFSIPALLLWWIYPLVNISKRFQNLELFSTKLKSNPTVFRSLLEEQPTLSIDRVARRIVIGNPIGETIITIVNNPYCHHCASMHKRLKNFLNKYRDRVRVELLFVGEDFLKETIQSLIGIYFQYGSEEAERIYSEWFDRYEKIVPKYPVFVESDLIDPIYEAQNKWMESPGKKGTPTIYVNNKELPAEYTLEDIRWIF